MKDLTHWTLKLLFPFVASNLHDIYDICPRSDAALVYLKLKIWSNTRNGKHLVVARCRSTRFISRICLGLIYKTLCEYGDLKPKHNQICHFPNPQAAAARTLLNLICSPWFATVGNRNSGDNFALSGNTVLDFTQWKVGRLQSICWQSAELSEFQVIAHVCDFISKSEPMYCFYTLK